MTRAIYLRSLESSVLGRVIEELLGEGFDPDRIQVHAMRRMKRLDAPVTWIRHRSDARALLGGALVGVLLASPIVALLLFPASTVASLVLILGVIVGGAFGLLRNRTIDRDLGPQADALRRGELLMVLEVEDANAARIEDRIKARHPEIAVLGTDPAGTPPFP